MFSKHDVFQNASRITPRGYLILCNRFRAVIFDGILIKLDLNGNYKWNPLVMRFLRLLRVRKRGLSNCFVRVTQLYVGVVFEGLYPSITAFFLMLDDSRCSAVRRSQFCIRVLPFCDFFLPLLPPPLPLSRKHIERLRSEWGKRYYILLSICHTKAWRPGFIMYID